MKTVTLFAQPDGRTLVREVKETYLPTDTTTFTTPEGKFQVKYEKDEGFGFNWEEKSLDGKPIAASLNLTQSYADITVADETEIA